MPKDSIRTTVRGLFVIVPTTLFLLPVLGCGDDARACVTHSKTDKSEFYYCTDMEEDDTCEDGSFYTEELHEEKSCADIGYAHDCTEADTREYGLQGGPFKLSNAGCDPTRPAGDGSDGPSSSGGSCGSEVWTCANDGQATPTCQYACTFPSGSSERKQTCQVLASMLESGDPSECCKVCR